MLRQQQRFCSCVETTQVTQDAGAFSIRQHWRGELHKKGKSEPCAVRKPFQTQHAIALEFLLHKRL